MKRLFRRAYRALRTGGVFAFDSATPDRLPSEGTRQHWSVGPDWAVLSGTSGNSDRTVLTRAITTFRKHGRGYRRSDELHIQRLYEPPLTGYRTFKLLPTGLRVIVASK